MIGLMVSEAPIGDIALLPIVEIVFPKYQCNNDCAICGEAVSGIIK